MDFKSLRDQILTNVDSYTTSEIKIVLNKLLTFIIDMNEKNSKLEKENEFIKNEIKSNNTDSGEYKTKVDEIINKANLEANKIIEEAKKTAKETLDGAEEKKQEVINTGLAKLEPIVSELKKMDEEIKVYRNHILTVFKNNIFKFADSDFYIVKSDDEDLKALLKFFETDDQIQKICDETINKLSNDPKYKDVKKEVDNAFENKKENHIDEKHVKLINEEEKDEPIETKTHNIDVIEDEIKRIENDEPIDDYEEESMNQLNKQKFLEIINKYNNK